MEVFSKDEVVEIESIVVEALDARGGVKFMIPRRQLDFTRHASHTVFTNIKCP